jgi:hypothetical protein
VKNVISPPAIVRPAEDTLDALAKQINAAHEAATESISRGLLQARHSGQLLLQAKAKLSHGQWLPWLREKTNVSERLAQQYMKIASQWERLSAKSETRVSDLSFRGALEVLAQKDEPEAQEAPPAPGLVMPPMPAFREGCAYVAVFDQPGPCGCPPAVCAHDPLHLIEIVPSAAHPGFWRYAVVYFCTEPTQERGGFYDYCFKGRRFGDPADWQRFALRLIGDDWPRARGWAEIDAADYRPFCEEITEEGAALAWHRHALPGG